LPRGKLFWQIYPSFLLITLGAIVAVSLYVRHVVYDFHEQRIRQELEARARLAEDCAESQLAAGRIDEVQQMARAMGEKANARFTIILPDGVVVGDSH
jgi:two-component system phosphate regulon sensor histidine kinase PhoR